MSPTAPRPWASPQAMNRGLTGLLRTHTRGGRHRWRRLLPLHTRPWAAHHPGKAHAAGTVTTYLGLREFARFNADLVADLIMTAQPEEVPPLVPISIAGIASTT